MHGKVSVHVHTHTISDKITFIFFFDREIIQIEEKSASNFAPIYLEFQRPLNMRMCVCEVMSLS